MSSETKMPCANCLHTSWNHTRKAGKCLQTNCDCKDYKPAAEMPSFEDWMKAQPVEIAVQIDAGEGRVLDTTYSSLYDLEYSLRKMESAVEIQLREEYDEIVTELEEEDDGI